MLNQNSIIPLSHSRNRSSEQRQTKFDFDIDAFSQQCAARTEVEEFIQQGFKKAYAANIEITMPYLLAVNNGKLKAALGIRSASSPLFVEQYLSAPIELHPVLSKKNISREAIAEIGHLYSNAHKFTIPLFLLTTVSLFCLDFKYLVFSATERVLAIVKAAGVEATYLVDADPAKLIASGDDWGSYYQTNPKVVLIDLASVMAVIDSQPVYQQLFSRLQEKIAQACRKLEMLK